MNIDDFDIDKVIEEGVQKFKLLQEQANQQIDKVQNESVENAFDFNLQTMDKFMFQDKDYREEKEKAEEAILELQVEQ